jgi:hypothetical protein
LCPFCPHFEQDLEVDAGGLDVDGREACGRDVETTESDDV